MAKNCLIDISYRNICFMNFLNDSLTSWKEILKSSGNKTLREQQDEFRVINDFNLIKYQERENVAKVDSKENYLLKIETINNFAKINKFNLSKDISLEEINSLVDKYVYPQIINKLTDLKKEQNKILQLLFPQLINNLFATFELFQKIKNLFFSDLKGEMSNYSDLLLKSNEKEEALVKEINSTKTNLKKANTQYDKERKEYEKKIKLMEEEMKILKEKNSTDKTITEKEYEELSKKYQDVFNLNNSLLFHNEAYASDIEMLKAENNFLKNKIEKVENDLNEEKRKKMELIQKLENDLNNEKKERTEQIKKLENALQLEKEQRLLLKKELLDDKEQKEKKRNELINFMLNYNNEILKKINDVFDSPEKK